MSKMSMFYGEGRLYGNSGTYVVEDAKDYWDAERLIRNATASKEQVQMPKLKKVTKNKEKKIRDIVEYGENSLRGSGVVFLEFVFIDQLI